jgi:hypothetical protein
MPVRQKILDQRHRESIPFGHLAIGREGVLRHNSGTIQTAGILDTGLTKCVLLSLSRPSHSRHAFHPFPTCTSERPIGAHSTMGPASGIRGAANKLDGR